MHGRAQEGMKLAAEQGLSQWLGLHTLCQGWALVGQGHPEEGFVVMRQGLTTWQATEAQLWLPIYLCALAIVHEQVGQVEEGLAAIAEALRLVDKNDERLYEAELYRIRGELLLMQGIKNQKPVLSAVEGAKMTNPQPLTSNP